MARNTNFCTCRDCKSMKRKGFVLGSTTYKHFAGNTKGLVVRVSAYIPYHRWQSGPRPT